MSFTQILLLKPLESVHISSEKMSLIYLFYISIEIKQLQISVFNFCGIICYILVFFQPILNTVSCAGNATNPEVCGQAVNEEKVCLRRKTSAE